MAARENFAVSNRRARETCKLLFLGSSRPITIAGAGASWSISARS